MEAKEEKICPLLFIGAAIRQPHPIEEMTRSVSLCVEGDCGMWRRFGEKGYCGLAGDVNQT